MITAQMYYEFDSILHNLPPPIEEFLTPNYIYNKVKPQLEYNRLENLYKHLNFLPCEIINKIIYQNQGIMTPTAKLINDITTIKDYMWPYNLASWNTNNLFKPYNNRIWLKINNTYQMREKKKISHIHLFSKKELQELLINNGINYKKSWTKKKLLFKYFVNDNDKLTNKGVKEAIQIEITPIKWRYNIFTHI